MKLMILVILSLAAAVTIGLVSLENPGLMILSWGSHSVELPLMLALLLVAAVFAILYLLLNFLFSLLRAPKKAKVWNEARQNKNAQTDTLRGYARLIEGDWLQGEKDLLKRMPYCKTPMLNYLGAAYAAQQQHNYTQRDEYLSLAEGIDPKNRMAVDISRARMLTQAGQFADARELLGEMQQHAPANKTILRLMADVCQRTEDWEGLKVLLPRLEKVKALPEEQLLALDVAVREAGLNQLLPDVQASPTISQYYSLPRKRKKNSKVAAVYARKLIDEGELASAEDVIRMSMKKNWDSELAGLYGKTRIENISRQIALATSWLTEHEQDANLNLTLARLNYANGQLDKARVYYNMAIELGAGDEAFLELGQFYEDEGNHKTALAYYKRGIQSSMQDGGKPQGDQAMTERLESVVTPGSSEISLIEEVDQPGDSSEQSGSSEPSVQDVEVIEHKAQA